MNDIDIFYQVEGVPEIQHISAPPDETLGALKARITAKHGISDDASLFAEDDDGDVDETKTVGAIATPAGVKVHLHRCRRVCVTVAFAGRMIEHKFGPGATVARVKRWAAQQLGMSKEDAGEHVLQISGTHDRPTPSTHIGTLAKCPACRVAFDLVPDERVNGGSAI
ncbi:hypothetical protein [Sandaracinus amylolyticus]|uniref:hypothetical protein n=1 Tax=Sandaracinus amylolyticus TaxID=927083 RepID=UPI001F2AEC93|nr:hypothetical protein [Sandaracinus amylolyticus]UJR83677.1 Hypothetical protein I5071_57460 [Sandaracinus amylolyticus]